MIVNRPNNEGTEPHHLLEARITGGELFPFFDRYHTLKPAYDAQLAKLDERR